MIKEPDIRPIPSGQVVTQVKGMFTDLNTVTAKTRSIDEAWQLFRAKHALVALHRTLLHEHHEFFLASQHPSASPALRNLAAKYAMLARKRRYHSVIIHDFLDLLQHSELDSLEPALLAITLPAFEDAWIKRLGDPGRRRTAAEIGDLPNTSVVSGKSSPTTGRLYRPLAVLARPNAVRHPFYYYTKSLGVEVPVLSADECLVALLDPSPGPSLAPDKPRGSLLENVRPYSSSQNPHHVRPHPADTSQDRHHSPIPDTSLHHPSISAHRQPPSTASSAWQLVPFACSAAHKILRGCRRALHPPQSMIQCVALGSVFFLSVTPAGVAAQNPEAVQHPGRSRQHSIRTYVLAVLAIVSFAAGLANFLLGRSKDALTKTPPPASPAVEPLLPDQMTLRYIRIVLLVVSALSLVTLVASYLLCFLKPRPDKTQAFVGMTTVFALVLWLGTSSGESEESDPNHLPDTINLIAVIAVLAGILNAESRLMAALCSHGDGDGIGGDEETEDGRIHGGRVPLNGGDSTSQELGQIRRSHPYQRTITAGIDEGSSEDEGLAAPVPAATPAAGAARGAPLARKPARGWLTGMLARLADVTQLAGLATGAS
ncbi:hypothetical protein VTJ83DRAFT_7508 [Remersonia thermophila]|uniref:Uncharacterized protein n=1 Tax=Remersonia thermophila TaxID=72144 RepID=A0ABR4D3P9_9PEZI